MFLRLTKVIIPFVAKVRHFFKHLIVGIKACLSGQIDCPPCIRKQILEKAFCNRFKCESNTNKIAVIQSNSVIHLINCYKSKQLRI